MNSELHQRMDAVKSAVHASKYGTINTEDENIVMQLRNLLLDNGSVVHESLFAAMGDLLPVPYWPPR